MWQGWDWKPGSLTLGSVGLAKMCSSSRRAVETGPGMWDSGGENPDSQAGGWLYLRGGCLRAHVPPCPLHCAPAGCELLHLAQLQGLWQRRGKVFMQWGVLIYPSGVSSKRALSPEVCEPYTAKWN